MSPDRSETTAGTETDRETDETTGTVQLLVADRGNRTAIREMLSEYFEVETGETVQDADLYLIEDHLFSEHRDALGEQIEREHPTFCPVVLIRRQTTDVAHPTMDTAFQEGSILIDDIVDAPIDRSLLIRRLHSLLVRRRQSLELSGHVSTLEEREQDLRRFERGVESTGNGIVMTDRLGEIEYVNPAFEKITGYRKSEILGETPRTLQPAGAADVFTGEFWRTMIDREEWAGEIVIEHRDETRSVVDTSIRAIHDDGGDVEGFVIVLNDITERIEQERELQRREGELELLRQILTRYLRHNLRNDLNIILGYSEIVASDGTLSDSQARMVERIVETAQQLRKKSDTARQYSTLLRQDTEPSPHDLTGIIRDSVRTISEQYPDVAFDIDVPETCEISARTGIRDAVEELVENAAKHIDGASPRVRIRLECSNGVRLVIEDNGPGIPELELATLEKGKETPLSHSQGIGLWLSKWVIESAGGRLSFDLLDPGTRVTVEFASSERVGSGGLDVPTLKERDQRLRTVIDRMTDAIIELNAAWEITFVDARAEEIFDVSADEIREMDFRDVFPGTLDTPFESVYREVMNSRTSRHIEAYYPGIDGWLSVYVYPEFNGGLSLYIRETTERNRRERERQQARSRMELALGVTDSTVWEWNVETDVVTTHPKRHTAFGTKITNGSEFLDAIHPEDRAQVREALRTAIKTETPYSVEYRIQRDGETRWVTDHGELRTDGADGSTRLLGVARDVTERKNREKELYQSKRTIDRAPTGITITDPRKEDNPLVYVNDRFCQLTGYTEAEALDRNCRFLQGENTDPETVARLREAIDAEEPLTVELRNYRKDGTEFWNRLSITPVYGEDGSLVNYVGFQQDISERKAREERLEQAYELLEHTERIAEVGSWEIDTETMDVFWSENLFEILGIDADEAPPLDEALDVYHEADRPLIETAVETALETGEAFDVEARFQRPDGEIRWLRIQGTPTVEEGDVTALRGAVQDITERKNHEQ